MGYKKYSPFLKSIKVLILLSFVYLTTRLEAIDPKIPVTLKSFDYQKLPVYCKSTTKHFECKDEDGEMFCLPESLKCKIRCSNDAELNCPHAATSCGFGQLKCMTNDSLTCLPKSLLCDGRRHCPNGEDELPDLCDDRLCADTEFSCKSPGHCIDKSKRCDGKFDCDRAGLNDKSDEENCPKLTLANCTAGQFRCKDGSRCVSQSKVCDTHYDCDDGSDELASCRPDCPTGQFLCDGRCAKDSLRCDGTIDCKDELDEVNCNYKQCTFMSQFYCKYSKQCVGKLNKCDGNADCKHGEDEVCPASNFYCALDTHWTCKSGSHCVLKSSRCDGFAHCPDGSDELDCPTPTPRVAPACSNNRHLCNGTAAVCVDFADVCSGRDKCPNPDKEVDAACHLLINSRNPCKKANGGCQHECVATVNASGVVPECRCRKGYRLIDGGRCVDIDECQVFGSCSQLCQNTIGGHTCSCLPGYIGHGNRCQAPGAAKILFSTANSIKYIDTDSQVQEVLVGNLVSPKYIAYDMPGRRVFFHTRDAKVGSVGLNGSNRRVLQKNVVMDAIAYDWARQLLFYTAPKGRDGSPGHLGVIDANTGFRSRLVSLDCPRGLAVDPAAGRLFVTLWCGQPGIYSVRLDGTDIRRVLDSVRLPGHLVLDAASSPKRLFWVDFEKRGIYSATVEGRDVRSHFNISGRSGLLFDLAVLGDRLYWNNLETGKVSSIDKLSGDGYKEVASDGTIFSVAVYHSLLQPAVQVGGCNCSRHICISGVAENASPTCLCDLRFTRDPNTGKCVNGTHPDTKLDSEPQEEQVTQPPAVQADRAFAKATAEPNTGEQLGNVGVVAGIAIAALAICALAGAVVAAFCLRHQDSQSMHLHHQSDHFYTKRNHHHLNGRMPKVDSRTPLTDYEIEVDNSAQTSSTGSNSSRF